jgi:hypothetical protein
MSTRLTPLFALGFRVPVSLHLCALEPADAAPRLALHLRVVVARTLETKVFRWSAGVNVVVHANEAHVSQQGIAD